MTLKGQLSENLSTDTRQNDVLFGMIKRKTVKASTKIASTHAKNLWSIGYLQLSPETSEKKYVVTSTTKEAKQNQP